MLDVSLLGNGQRIYPDTSDWFDNDSTTYLNFIAGESGTWVSGVSTKSRDFAMSAEDFNKYLKHDGLLDMLESRTQRGILTDSAVERYSKHVKTVFQVGDKLTEDYKTALGYPIEFLLLENPYDIHPGHQLPVKLLFDQKPLPNQLVYVGYKGIAHEHTHGGSTHSHADGADHDHDELTQYRTDEQGMINVPITAEGIWYIRTIHLVEVEEAGLTHESNWATITFAVTEGHAHGEEGHRPDDEIPAYIYFLISLVVIGGLFFWFNRK